MHLFRTENTDKVTFNSFDQQDWLGNCNQGEVDDRERAVSIYLFIYLFTVIYIAHFPYFNAQMRCTGYEMARYKGTQASHLYEKSMHTLCSIL